MSEITFVTPQEQALSRKYDEQRRLRLARVVASASSVLTTLISLALTSYLLFHLHSTDPLIFVLTFMAWLDIACYGLGVIAARHGQANLAALCVCGGAMLTIIAMLVYSLAISGLTLLSLGLLFFLGVIRE